jgi:hypothetical protein
MVQTTIIMKNLKLMGLKFGKEYEIQAVFSLIV